MSNIKSMPTNDAYREGWDRTFGKQRAAFHHPDSETIEDAVRGDTEATDEAEVDRIPYKPCSNPDCSICDAVMTAERARLAAQRRPD